MNRSRPTGGRWSSAHDIDLIDIASTNDTHDEIAIAAAQAGKMVMCEKPLGRNAKEAEAMVAAVEEAGVANMVWYNYRRVPAVTLLKQLIDEGRLGRIFHYRAKFLQDWTISQDLPQGGAGLWRLDVKVAGSGVTGDLLAHCIDTALWLNGSITEVTAMTETFVKERKHNLTGQGRTGRHRRRQRVPEPVRERLAGDVRGDPLRTRPQGALHAGDQRRARLAFWDLHDLHRLQYFDHGDEGRVRGWRSIHVTDGDQPYMKHWWVPGLQIGYEHTFIHQFADFLDGLAARARPWRRLSATRCRPTTSPTPSSNRGAPEHGRRCRSRRDRDGDMGIGRAANQLVA